MVRDTKLQKDISMPDKARAAKNKVEVFEAVKDLRINARILRSMRKGRFLLTVQFRFLSK